MSEQLKPFYLHHLAVCDEDGLRWMTGRCMPAGIDSVELYAAKDFGRAPELVLKADADAALAAKDARIAELEELLRYVRESAIYDNTVQAERIDDALCGEHFKAKFRSSAHGIAINSTAEIRICGVNVKTIEVPDGLALDAESLGAGVLRFVRKLFPKGDKSHG